LVLTAPGDFRGDLTWVKLKDTSIVQGCENLARIGYVQVAPGMVLLSLALDLGAPDAWGGATLGKGDGYVHGAGGRVHHRTAGASRWTWIAIAQERLDAHCRALLQTGFSAPSSPIIVHPGTESFSRLSRLVADACRIATSKRGVVAHREAMRALELHVLDAAVECLTTTRSREPRSRRAAVVADFEDVLETCGQDTHLPAILAMLGRTERVLRSACAECLGMSPNEYRRLRRLNRVRSALLHAQAAASVSEIAAAFGITELGRFAGEYRTAFGETPSVTLRSASPCATLPS
jgi:AraC family ethanolamine operon transcriptional activator